MRKEEFFDKLEYLLQDIPDQDREDALDYYRDYLAEAGSGLPEGGGGHPFPGAVAVGNAGERPA